MDCFDVFCSLQIIFATSHLCVFNGNYSFNVNAIQYFLFAQTENWLMTQIYEYSFNPIRVKDHLWLIWCHTQCCRRIVSKLNLITESCVCARVIATIYSIISRLHIAHNADLVGRVAKFDAISKRSIFSIHHRAALMSLWSRAPRSIERSRDTNRQSVVFGVELWKLSRLGVQFG